MAHRVCTTRYKLGNFNNEDFVIMLSSRSGVWTTPSNVWRRERDPEEMS